MTFKWILSISLWNKNDPNSPRMRESSSLTQCNLSNVSIKFVILNALFNYCPCFLLNATLSLSLSLSLCESKIMLTLLYNLYWIPWLFIFCFEPLESLASCVPFWWGQPICWQLLDSNALFPHFSTKKSLRIDLVVDKQCFFIDLFVNWKGCRQILR